MAGTFYYAVTVTDADGCNGTSDSTTVIISLCTSVEELNNEVSVNIFPVPANEFVNLQLQNKFSVTGVIIELYSSLGEIVFETKSREKK